MGSFTVNGGVRLNGSVRIKGAKNAILPILAASILTDGEVVIHDCPHITDVDNMLDILLAIGCRIKRSGDTVIIDASGADSYVMPPSISKKLRSSIFMLGAVVGRFKKACFTYPGGCEIGNRPIDLHLSGLSGLNVKVTEEYGLISCEGEDIRGANIHLDYPSVGATENIMMAAVTAKGDSVIYNAAREPEIEDLQCFLNAMGYDVRGAGTTTIYIRGGGRPGAVEHRLIPDRIVAGTLLCMGAMTGGTMTIENVCMPHIMSLISKLREIGCTVEAQNDTVRLKAPGRISEIRLLETMPYPGFPTDMQAQVCAMCCVADGTSILVENVFENRYKHIPELVRMGAEITIRDRTAIIRGVPKLSPAELYAKDLRGGAALVAAALKAEGKSRVHGVELIDRGYERLEDTLNALGAEVARDGG